jgi:two-component system, NtrC family, response regulator AtoC
MAPKDDDATLQHGQSSASGDGELLLVAGEGRLTTHVLHGNEIVIGRAPECDVVIDHRALSRRHAVVRRNPQLTVQDLGSMNGTRLARGVLKGGEAMRLEPGESFHIGPFAFIVIAGRAEEPSTLRTGKERLVVEDPMPDRVKPLVHEIARSMVNVLIQGETGVGKDVLASTIHALSGRSGPLLRVNCAALTETLLESELFGHEKGAFTGAVASKAGLLEAAMGGSVFLDEIGELPLGIQAKLLRAVEAREILRLGSTRPIAIDVRFIAATNRELPAEVASGRFRGDLYFRLDGVSLRIPPLRDRAGLIGPLALRFLAESARQHGRRMVQAAPELLAALEGYDWPGNVRELKAVIERAVLLARGGEIGARHLAFSPRPVEGAPLRPVAAAAMQTPPPSAAPASGDRDHALLTDKQREDRDRLVAALDTCAGNQTRAAKLLGISRTTLVTKLALYRIKRPRT